MKRKFKHSYLENPDSEERAELTVRVPGFESLPLSVEIHDIALRKIGVSRTEQKITVSPGSYLLQIHDPGGELHNKVVHLDRGEEANVEIQLRHSESVTERWQEKMADISLEESISPSYLDPPDLIGKPLDLVVEWSRDDERGKQLMLTIPITTGQSRSSESGPVNDQSPLQTGYIHFHPDPREIVGQPRPYSNLDYGFLVRVLKYVGGNWKPVVKNNGISGIKNKLFRQTVRTRFHFSPPDEGLYFLELQRPTGKPACVALPVAHHTAAASCKVEIVNNGQNLRALSMLDDSARTQVISEYLENNAVEQALELMEDAEDLLREKYSNPIAAALGGYALLRLGNLSYLHNWPNNLANDFAWLPDGAVIAGELAARKGQHVKAAKYLLKATERGLPLFQEGLGLLMGRIRSYLFYGKRHLHENEMRLLLKAAFEKLMPWVGQIDNDPLMLVLRGSSLAPESTFEVEAGWQLFQPDLENQSNIPTITLSAHFLEE